MHFDYSTQHPTPPSLLPLIAILDTSSPHSTKTELFN